MKYKILKYFISALIISSLSCTSKKSQVKSEEKPNIIFILTDDLGWGDLGVLFQNRRRAANDPSEPWEYTPNLDMLASQGVQMPQHYCAAPVCAPSRSSILTGESQGHTSVRDNQFDKALKNNYTLGSVLQALGYSTAAIGKWGLQGLNAAAPNWPAHPLNRGFDFFYGYIRHKDGHEHYPKEGKYDGPKEVWFNRTNVAEELDKCYTADLWTSIAKKWIIDHKKGKDADKPFFIYLAYDTPHAVLELPAQAYPKGGGLNGGVQFLGTPGHMINTASGKIDSWIHPDYADAAWDDDKNSATPKVPWPDVYKRYATAVRRIDNGVGDIMQLLKDLKIDSNTLIVFTSDNGPSIESYLPKNYKPNYPTFFNSFGPFDGIKRDCWEGGVRMPTLASWPGHIPAGGKIEKPSISYDWLPTFLDAAGYPAPAVSDGVSLIPELTGAGKQQDPLIYIEYFNNGKTPDFNEFSPKHRNRLRNQMQVIRLGDYLGVRYNIQSADDNFEIYDINKDPQQIKNLADKLGMDSIQEKMKEKVLQVRRPNDSSPRPYDNTAVPVSVCENPEPGLSWKEFQGPFHWLPQVSSLDPIQTGFTDLPGTGNIGSNIIGNLLFYEGYINIPQDGEYSFCLTSADKALLRIHEAVLIDEDFDYSGNEEHSGVMNLKKGLHSIRLYAMENGEDKPDVKLEWSSKQISKQQIPGTVFFHNEK
jgi:arylsulfatase A-like enzyme